MTLEQKIQYAKEQYLRVLDGYMPTPLGRELIGKIDEMEALKWFLEKR